VRGDDRQHAGNTDCPGKGYRNNWPDPPKGMPTRGTLVARTRPDEPEDFDPEGPDPAEWDADDERALIACPYCRAEIDEESVKCPKCGMFISREDAPSERKSVVWIVLMVLALLATLVWVLG